MLLRARHKSQIWLRRIAGLTVVVAVGCSGHSRGETERQDSPAVRDFLQFPKDFALRRIRLGPLLASRIEVSRPLILTDPEHPDDTVLVLDSRMLVGRHKIRVGQLVDVVIHCTEGRSDRGNVLLAIEAAATTAPSE